MLTERANDLLSLLTHHAPNGMRVEWISAKSGLSPEEVLEISKELTHKNLVRSETRENDFLNRSYVVLSLTNPLDYPIRRTIIVGDRKFPRYMNQDVFGAEEMNVPLEAISEYTQELESRFTRTTNEHIKKYWANSILLFGMFLAVFTLIMAAIPKVQVESGRSLQHIILLNSAALVPQAVILLAFVLLLRALFRKYL